MQKPSTGYYRELLKGTFPEVRIAFTHTPIIGCTKVNAIKIIQELKKCSDPFAAFYVEGLEKETMLPIVENSIYDKKWAPGELYFKT
jgi:hypothetical protein